MIAKPAADATFYDQALVGRTPSLMADVEKSPYYALYSAVIALVPKGADVVELGCGTGRLAEMLRMRVGNYVGLDFAPRVIEEARRYVQGGDFRLADLRTAEIPDADVYVTLEVLEHLDDDLGLLRRLPRGRTVILSVPSFPSFDPAAHVRWFPERGSARVRYADLLDIDTEAYLDLPRPGAYFHLLRGILR